MKEIVVEFNSKRTFDHIHYVGLSRVTAIDGLFIKNLAPEKISVNQDVVSEMSRRRKDATIHLQQSEYLSMNAYCKILFLNVRSLHRHLKEVASDYNVMCSDIVIFSETRIETLTVTKNTSWIIFNCTVFMKCAHNTGLIMEQHGM